MEQAVAAAERGEKNAAALLQDFVRRFPDHPRVSEAYIASADIAYHATPPRLDDAEKNLAAARGAHPTELAIEQADYLAIWLADARAADSDRVIAAARDFLHAHPHSSLAAEVRLKLAESHFRRQDFASAQTEFETLAQENPKSEFTEQALFLAAQSAMASMASHSLDHALELLTQVVAMKGDFRWSARNEQAAIERRLGKPDDAQALYDEVLKGDARGTEKREALCGKADIFFEQANTNAANLERAVGIYDQLANGAANQPHWRNQALFKKGVCLEKESDREGALATFYRILEFNPSPEKPPEFFWFYKAGFNAAACWRRSKNGKPLRWSTKNWWQPTARAVRRQAHGWVNCGWSTSFGNDSRKRLLVCHCLLSKSVAYFHHEQTVQAAPPGRLRRGDAASR